MPNPMTVRHLAVAVVAADPVVAMVMVVVRGETHLHPCAPIPLRRPQRLWWTSPWFKKLS